MKTLEQVITTRVQSFITVGQAIGLLKEYDPAAGIGSIKLILQTLADEYAPLCSRAYGSLAVTPCPIDSQDYQLFRRFNATHFSAVVVEPLDEEYLQDCLGWHYHAFISGLAQMGVELEAIQMINDDDVLCQVQRQLQSISQARYRARTLLNIIHALVECVVGAKPLGGVKSKTALIQYLSKHYEGYTGLSARTLERVLKDAQQSLDDSL